MNNESNQSNLNNTNIAPSGNIPTSTPVTPVVQNGIPQPTAVASMQNDSLQNVQNQVPTNSEVPSTTTNQPGSDYVPPSKGKVFFMFFCFALLIGFVIFLPNITEMIHKYQSGNNQKPVEEIVDGKLTCTLEKSTDVFDLNYTAIFSYTNTF